MSNAERPILLVEDNPDDEALTLRAFSKNRITNPVVVAHDGVEALDYLFCTGPHAGRNPHIVPAVVLLDLKLPVVILTTSKEQQDIFEGYTLGANSYIRKPVDFEKFIQAVGQLGLYWLVLNEAMEAPRP